MAEEKDRAAQEAPKRPGRRKKPEAEKATRAAPKTKDAADKAQDAPKLTPVEDEPGKAEPKPELEAAEQVVMIPLSQLRPFKDHPFKVRDDDELMQDTIDSIMASGVINPIWCAPRRTGNLKWSPVIGDFVLQSWRARTASRPLSGRWTMTPPLSPWWTAICNGRISYRVSERFPTA